MFAKNLLHSLKFQIISSLVLLATGLTITTIYTGTHFEEQISSGIVLQQAEKLNISAQRLTIQGMAYQENPARDYDSYARDIHLYHQDMMLQITTFDHILEGFMAREFPPSLTGMDMTANFTLDPQTYKSIQHLIKIWEKFKRELEEVQGEDKNMPKLEWGAEYIIKNHGAVDDAVEQLIQTIHHQLNEHNKSIKKLNMILIAAAIIGSLIIFVWLIVIIVIPLNRLSQELQPLANGQFNSRISPVRHNEINEVVDILNNTTSRLSALFQLLETIQQSKKPTYILEQVVQAFDDILPIDWLGVLFVTPDHSSIKIQYCFPDNTTSGFGQNNFSLDNTPLAQSINQSASIHIPSIRKYIEGNPHYEFLTKLHKKGYQEALLFPLHDQKPFRGILVFAHKQEQAYTDAQIELIDNIGSLIALTFSRTLTLVESSRLASIGQFTSSIVHELRNPLATVRIALDYLENQEMEEKCTRRLTLASTQTNRITRLLDDILNYAKPIHLRKSPVDIQLELRNFVEAQQCSANDRSLSLSSLIDPQKVQLNIDVDRILQVLDNVINNAYDAANPNSEINIESNVINKHYKIVISNSGCPIPEQILKHIFEPFVTDKASGTGLGLAICKRIIDGHSGQIYFSHEADKTMVSIHLPIN